MSELMLRHRSNPVSKSDHVSIEMKTMSSASPAEQPPNQEETPTQATPAGSAEDHERAGTSPTASQDFKQMGHAINWLLFLGVVCCLVCPWTEDKNWLFTARMTVVTAMSLPFAIIASLLICMSIEKWWKECKNRIWADSNAAKCLVPSPFLPQDETSKTRAGVFVPCRELDYEVVDMLWTYSHNLSPGVLVMIAFPNSQRRIASTARYGRGDQACAMV
ncbi:unnamed protein product [Sympodiomycopsis kandeliae]